jgi:hypothetical protein
MHYPDFLTELDRVDYTEGIALEPQRDLEHARPKARIGFAISALPPSAAIVRAARQIDFAPSGKVSNSFSAALIHEMGRVVGVICPGSFIPRVVTSDNRNQQ